MKRSELNALKAKATTRKVKAEDMDTLVASLLKLPPGQRKKVLTDEVKAVLVKYGYKE